MRTVKEITGLQKPILEDYIEMQSRKPKDDCYEAYMGNLEAYAYNLEKFIEREEAKKEGYMSLLKGDLKDLEGLNNRAIDLNYDIYLMLADSQARECLKSEGAFNQRVFDALHEQWYDVLEKQERIIMGLQNFINMKKTGRGEQKDESK